MIGYPNQSTIQTKKHAFIFSQEIADLHPIVPIIMEHRRISKQLSLLQGLLEQVCLVDMHARATAEACATMLANGECGASVT